MVKRLLILVLIVAVGVLGMPVTGMAAHHGTATMAMADCDCPPGQAPGDMPCCHNGGMDGCPPSLDCLTHCGLAAPVATAVPQMRMPEPVSKHPVLLADSPGRLLSSIYPPYRPPQV